MRYIFALIAALMPVPAMAHPHVFIATGLKLELDEAGALKGIEVRWQYDELYSLLVLEDMGLDSDYDGVLTKAEVAQLAGFDLQWVEGFAGDLYMRRAGEPVGMGAPELRGLTFENGKITSSHYRAIDGGAAQAVEIRAYDPTYYTAYDLGLGIDVPAGCKVQIRPVNLTKAQQALQDELAKLPMDAELDYPQVGEDFADVVEVSCAD